MTTHRPRDRAGSIAVAVLLAVVAIAALSACIGRAQGTAGLEPGRIEVDGTERTYLVRVPSAYQPGTPAPLVLVLHGLGGSGASVARQSGFADEAERDGFIAVFPDGRPLPAVGGGRGWALTAGGNPDLRFIAALLDRLQVEYSIDPSRVFVAGHSNGAFFGYRIACELADRVAALAVVAGAMVNNCAPSAPVSVLHIHGTADPLVPYEGGRAVLGLPSLSAAESVRRWGELNGCGPEPVSAGLAGTDGRVSLMSYPSCVAGTAVELVTIDGGGHGWPRPATGFDATAAAWRFFEAHAR